MGDEEPRPHHLTQLPMPADGKELIGIDVMALPGEQLPTIGQVMKVGRTQYPDPVVTALGEQSAATTPALGKDDIHLEPPCAVTDFGLLPFVCLHKTLLFQTFNVKFGDIALVFGLAQRDQQIPTVALLAPV